MDSMETFNSPSAPEPRSSGKHAREMLGVLVLIIVFLFIVGFAYWKLANA